MTVHGLHVLYPDTEWPEYPFTHLRLWDCFVHWGAVHTGPGVFDWSRLDTLVEKARAAGAVNLSYVIGHTPTWLSTVPDASNAAPWLNRGGNYPPSDLAQFDAFVAALGSRYRGRIGSYQVWNEPQLKWFWGPAEMGTVGLLTRRARRVLRSVDPGAKVVSAPVLPWYGRGQRYLQALQAEGWPVDVHAAHVYAGDGVDVHAWTDTVREWKRLLRGLDAPRKPLWVTETNTNHMLGPIPRRRVEPWMRGVAREADRMGVARMYWYAQGSHSDTSLLGIPFTPGSEGSRVLARLAGPRLEQGA